MLQTPVSAGKDLVLTVEAALRETGLIIVNASLDTVDKTAAGVGFILLHLFRLFSKVRFNEDSLKDYFSFKLNNKFLVIEK